MSIVRTVLRALGTLIGEGWNAFWGLIGRIVETIEHWLVDRKHALYGIALSRILLGVTAIGILLTDFASRSYLYGPASAWKHELIEPVSALARVWIFSLPRVLAGNSVLLTILILVLVALGVLVTLGWRGRIVMPVFFVLYVGLIELANGVGNQGDSAFRILFFFLMFADHSAVLSLDARRRARGVVGRNRVVRVLQGERILPEWFTNTVHNLVLVIFTAQVCFIYASGALYKAGGEEWRNGTAVYGPLSVIKLSPWPELSDLVVAWGPMLVIGAWGSIVLQMSFPFMLLHRFTRVIALIGILSFHGAIGVLLGLPWFSLTMVAADAIFIRDKTYLAFGAAVRRAWRSARGIPGPRREPGGGRAEEGKKTAVGSMTD